METEKENIENFKQEQKDKSFNGNKSLLSLDESEDIRLVWECLTCGAIIKQDGYDKPKCLCGKEKLKNIDWEYSESRLKEAGEKFRNPKLLNLIHQELSKNHIGDDNLKMTTFLTGTSGLLKNQKRRQSQAITGNSAEGKDNDIKTTLKHMPKDSFLFVTNATQSTIEDDIKDKRIIAFSEVNANREIGANKHLIEVIKQKTEGGTSVVKKDIRTGLKEARFEVGEQGSVLYGTTEALMDEEMQTRFIKSTIETNFERIKKVNENTFDTYADYDKLLFDSQERDSWLRVGLTYFYKKPEQFEIVIPYAIFLKDKIKEKDIFDHSNARSQRDIKRILSLTCAMTYLFQEQRKTITHKRQMFLISEPQDFINTLIISSEFFNQSYSGLDKRLLNVIKIMDETGREWVARDYLEEQMNVSKNTIKSYCQTLADEGLIEGTSGKELNEKEGIKVYDGNKIYYKRCQKGSKKPLIRCQINELKEFLEQKTGKQIDTFDFNKFIEDKKENEDSKWCQDKDVKIVEIKERIEKITNNIHFLAEIDTFSLTPFRPLECFEVVTLQRGMEIPLTFETDKIYPQSILGDLAKEMIEILVSDNKIKIEQEVKNE